MDTAATYARRLIAEEAAAHHGVRLAARQLVSLDPATVAVYDTAVRTQARARQALDAARLTHSALFAGETS